MDLFRGLGGITGSFCVILPVGSTVDGALTFLELPFEIRRLYWLVGPTGTRGGHAHKELRQVLACLGDDIEISLSDGTRWETVKLTPGTAIALAPGLWRDISPLRANAMLLVGASEPYSEDDYIRNFDDFRKWKSERV